MPQHTSTEAMPLTGAAQPTTDAATGVLAERTKEVCAGTTPLGAAPSSTAQRVAGSGSSVTGDAVDALTRPARFRPETVTKSGTKRGSGCASGSVRTVRAPAPMGVQATTSAAPARRPTAKEYCRSPPQVESGDGSTNSGHVKVTKSEAMKAAAAPAWPRSSALGSMTVTSLASGALVSTTKGPMHCGKTWPHELVSSTMA